MNTQQDFRTKLDLYQPFALLLNYRNNRMDNLKPMLKAAEIMVGECMEEGIRDFLIPIGRRWRGTTEPLEHQFARFLAGMKKSRPEIRITALVSNHAVRSVRPALEEQGELRLYDQIEILESGYEKDFQQYIIKKVIPSTAAILSLDQPKTTVSRKTYKAAYQLNIPVKSIFELSWEFNEGDSGISLIKSLELRKALAIPDKCAVFYFNPVGVHLTMAQLAPVLKTAVHDCAQNGITDFLFPLEGLNMIREEELTCQAVRIIRSMMEEYPDIRVFACILVSEESDTYPEEYDSLFHEAYQMEINGANRTSVFYDAAAKLMSALIAVSKKNSTFQLGNQADSQMIPVYNLYHMIHNPGFLPPKPLYSLTPDTQNIEKLELLERELGVYPKEHPIYEYRVENELSQDHQTEHYSYHRCLDLILDFIRFNNETAYLRGLALGMIQTDNLQKEVDHYSVTHTPFYRQFQEKLLALAEAVRKDGDSELLSSLYQKIEAVDRRLKIDQTGYLLLGFRSGRKKAVEFDEKLDEQFEDYCKEQMKLFYDCPFNVDTIGIISKIFREKKRT